MQGLRCPFERPPALTTLFLVSTLNWQEDFLGQKLRGEDFKVEGIIPSLSSVCLYGGMEDWISVALINGNGLVFIFGAGPSSDGLVVVIQARADNRTRVCT